MKTVFTQAVELYWKLPFGLSEVTFNLGANKNAYFGNLRGED